MPFQKGKSGNPNGRPKKGHAVSEIVAEIAAEKRDGSTRLKKLLLTLWANAENGCLQSTKILLPYIEPEPRAEQKITGEDMSPVRLIIRRDSDSGS